MGSYWFSSPPTCLPILLVLEPHFAHIWLSKFGKYYRMAHEQDWHCCICVRMCWIQPLRKQFHSAQHQIRKMHISVNSMPAVIRPLISCFSAPQAWDAAGLPAFESITARLLWDFLHFADQLINMLLFKLRWRSSRSTSIITFSFLDLKSSTRNTKVY